MGTIQIDGSTPKLTIGNATAEDATILFDGNAQDFYIALDDSADDLLIGLGSTVGTTPAISIDENLAIKTYGDITMTGTTPVLTIGDAGAEDTAIVFDGNAQDFYIGLDDSADDLVIGLGSSVGTTPAISINEDRDVTISDGAIDFDVASHDGSNGLKLGGTLVTATAAEINLIDGGTARGTTAIADGDGVLINDAGTMRMTSVETLATYIGGGITTASQWRLTSDATGDQEPLASNLEVVDTGGYGSLGSEMTESSGIFTFPSTGYWLITANVFFARDGTQRKLGVEIHTTPDNSTYTNIGEGYTFVYDSAASSNTLTSVEAKFLFDVTNTTNCKVKFHINVNNDSNITTGGNTNINYTYFTFIRLADT